MDIASTIVSVALTAAIVIPLVVAVVFIRQLRDIARSNRGKASNTTEGSIDGNGASRSRRSDSGGPAEPAEPEEGPDRPRSRPPECGH